MFFLYTVQGATNKTNLLVNSFPVQFQDFEITNELIEELVAAVIAAVVVTWWRRKDQSNHALVVRIITFSSFRLRMSPYYHATALMFKSLIQVKVNGDI